MAKYLISFPASAMDVSDEDMAAVGEATPEEIAHGHVHGEGGEHH